MEVDEKNTVAYFANEDTQQYTVVKESDIVLYESEKRIEILEAQIEYLVEHNKILSNAFAEALLKINNLFSDKELVTIVSDMNSFNEESKKKLEYQLIVIEEKPRKV